MSEHPVLQSARRVFLAQADQLVWAAEAAERAEAALAVVRALPADGPDGDAVDVLRAAAVAVQAAHQAFPGPESVTWMEHAVLELEGLAVARFGAGQHIVRLGYEPMREPARRPGPRSMFGL